MSVYSKVPMTINNPNVAMITYEGADQAAYILADWLKQPGTPPHIFMIVERVRNALLALCDDADVIMMEDS